MYKYSVSILGTGFIGLCSAASFAQKDIKVVASTHDEKKAKMINDGIAPFFEANLQEILDEIKERNPDLLQCSTDPVKAIADTNISMITQGTPMRDDKSIDLSYIESTAREIGMALKGKDIYCCSRNREKFGGENHHGNFRKNSGTRFWFMHAT